VQEITPSDLALLREKLSDPVWRICHLYQITDKKGRRVPFRPTPYQMQLIEAVYVWGVKRHIILKARQMGFSTLIAIIIFDALYWGENIQASIVDQNQVSASEKLTKKIRFAYENLPALLKMKCTQDSATVMQWANGSSVNAGKKARGGTNQFLHVSEWGPIAHEDPKRSEEIRTGALPTAEEGVIFVESTFKGGKGGDFYDLIKRAQEVNPSQVTEKDFMFWFFPWFEDQGYTMEGDFSLIPQEITKYFSELEKETGRTFTPGQMLWYWKTAQTYGIFMRREYPSTVAEALSAPVEGAIYADIIAKLRTLGCITRFEYEHGAPVYAAWDIGWNDTSVVWLFQVLGREIHWVYHVERRHATASEMANILRSTGIPVAANYLPHDAGNGNSATGTTYRAELEKAGMVNCYLVPRSVNRWSGINALRELLQRSRFNAGACADGLQALESYHVKDATSGGVISKEPVHDWSSHSSDAARIVAEALTLGMVRAPAGFGRKKVLRPGEMYSMDEEEPKRFTTALHGVSL